MNFLYSLEVFFSRNFVELINTILELINKLYTKYGIIDSWCGFIMDTFVIFTVIYFLMYYLCSSTKIINTSSLNLIEKFKGEGKYIESLFSELDETKETIRFFIYGKKWKNKIVTQFNQLYDNDIGKFLKNNTVNKSISYKISYFNSLQNIKRKIEKNKQIFDEYPFVKKYLKRKGGNFYDRLHSAYYLKYELEKIIEKSSMAIANCVLIKGSAGNGKTSLLCNLSSLIMKLKHPCVFVNSRDLENVENDIYKKLNFPSFLVNYSSYGLKLLNIKNLLTRKTLFIVIDAINENDSSNFRVSLPIFLNKFIHFKTIKIIMSCRSEYFDERYNRIFRNTDVHPYVYQIHSHYYFDECRNSYRVPLIIYKRYAKYFNFKGTVSQKAFIILMKSLLLTRIFFEVYKNKKDKILNLNKHKIYRQYIQQIENNVEDAQYYIENLTKSMVEKYCFDGVDASELNLTSQQLRVFRKICDENLLMSRKILKNPEQISEREEEQFYFVFDELRDYCISKYLIEYCQKKEIINYAPLFDFIEYVNKEHLSPLEGVIIYSYCHFRTIKCLDLCNQLLASFVLNINPYYRTRENNIFEDIGLNAIFNCNVPLLDFEESYILKVFNEKYHYYEYNNDIINLFHFLIDNEKNAGCYSFNIYNRILLNFTKIGNLEIIAKHFDKIALDKTIIKNKDTYFMFLSIIYLSIPYLPKHNLLEEIIRYKNIDIVLDSLIEKSQCEELKSRSRELLKQISEDS